MSSPSGTDEPTRHHPNPPASGPDGNPPPRPRPKAPPPPPPQQAPEPSFVDRIPSIRLSIPPKERFSPATSERCFTYCSQSHFGRASGKEPKCYTFCLRSIFDYEVRRVLTNVNYGPIVKAPTISADIPLPAESKTTLGQYLSDDAPNESHGDSAKPKPPLDAPASEKSADEQQHWQEGYYIWLSRSRQATSEHMSHMKRDLFQQSAYERSKMLWAQAVRDGKQQEFYRTPEAQTFGSEWTANMHEDILSPPHRSMLLPLSTPAPELQRVIFKYLAPTRVVLTRLHDSFTSGDQAKLAQRMSESIRDGAPWTLARNVGKKIWGLLSGEGDG
ncbi:hypothetical protein BC834DRAFT_890769 [Gloeopeniophorella convolvens]|nr:hypothetical protein BC834DRAFT_890769 [Gloeopeniophorella convolvens]